MFLIQRFKKIKIISFLIKKYFKAKRDNEYKKNIKAYFDENEFKTIIDIGIAYGTDWLYKAFPNSEYILIDPMPLPNNFKEKNKISFTYFQFLLSDKKGEYFFYINKDRPALDGLYKRTQQSNKKKLKFTKVKKHAITLDQLAKEFKLNCKKIMIKIDTEGSELKIIQGGIKTLKKYCSHLILEMSIKERFEGSYTSSELINYLEKNGFTLDHIIKESINYKDVIFINKKLVNI